MRIQDSLVPQNVNIFLTKTLMNVAFIFSEYTESLNVSKDKKKRVCHFHNCLYAVQILVFSLYLACLLRGVMLFIFLLPIHSSSSVGEHAFYSTLQGSFGWSNN